MVRRMDNLRFLADIDGVVLRRDALAAGATDGDLRRACRAGVLVRIRHGVYSLKEVWEARTLEERHLLLSRMAYEFARADVVLSHVSAALIHGAPLWDLSLTEVHLTRTDRKAGRREGGVVQHRGRLRKGDVVTVDGRQVTSPTRTALDLTTLTDLEHALPAMDHFLRTGQTSKEQLREGAAAIARWSNTLGTDLVVNFADGRRESLAESRTAVMLIGTGKPAPEPNFKIRDRYGNVLWRVDFAWPELGVFLEFDGKVKYQKFLKEGEDVTDAVLREKKREEQICARTGWRCIRLTWADLARPAETIRYVISVLEGGPIHR
jgi:hypothetical protein